MEYFFAVWLSLEICLVFAVSPDSIAFIANFMNVFDLLVVSFAWWSLSLVSSPGADSDGILQSLRASRVIRVLRVTRRILKYARRLRMILTSLYRALSPVLHIFILTFIVMSLYATLGASIFQDVAVCEKFTACLFTMAALATVYLSFSSMCGVSSILGIRKCQYRVQKSSSIVKRTPQHLAKKRQC